MGTPGRFTQNNFLRKGDDVLVVATLEAFTVFGLLPSSSSSSSSHLLLSFFARYTTLEGIWGFIYS